MPGFSSQLLEHFSKSGYVCASRVLIGMVCLYLVFSRFLNFCLSWFPHVSYSLNLFPWCVVYNIEVVHVSPWTIPNDTLSKSEGSVSHGMELEARFYIQLLDTVRQDEDPVSWQLSSEEFMPGD